MTEIRDQIEELSRVLLKWVDCNGLALNLKKTVYMIFSRQKISNLTVTIGHTQIEQVREARFLGVIVDDKLNWASHIRALRSKMTRYVGIMYKIKGLLPLKVRLQIFHCFVQSHLNFCSLVWGFAAKSHIESLFVAQKKGIRAIMPGYINYFFKDDCPPTHTKPAFKEYGVLTVHGVVVKNSLTFMHKVKNFPLSMPTSVRA